MADEAGNEGTALVTFQTLSERFPRGGEAARSRLDELPGLGATQLRLAFSRLGRDIPAEPLVASADATDSAALESADFFSTDILARMAFLLGLSEKVAPEKFLDAVTTLYRTGSDSEQVSVLRALPWLPQPERFVALASEACRTNDVRVFSALATENPFPTRYLADEALFQMVLKSMFLGVDTRRTWGLAKRVNDELLRMVSDFAAERKAAGRTIPVDAAELLQKGTIHAGQSGS